MAPHFLVPNNPKADHTSQKKGMEKQRKEFNPQIFRNIILNI